MQKSVGSCSSFFCKRGFSDVTIACGMRTDDESSQLRGLARWRKRRVPQSLTIVVTPFFSVSPWYSAMLVKRTVSSFPRIRATLLVTVLTTDGKL